MVSISPEVEEASRCIPSVPGAFTPLPLERLERIEAWGMSQHAMAFAYRPTNAAGISAVYNLARRTGHRIALRGAGRSYGDAALLPEQICLDLSRMRRILEWLPETGRVTVEPGVTLQQLWQYTLEDGWWPAVVSGTMFVTLGGAASMNIHGKNNWKVGPIGDHIQEFELLTPAGDILTCSRDSHPDIFHAAIGGFGMLGCITRITLQLKRVYSGKLHVTALPVRSFGHAIEEFESRAGRADYLVAWIDCFARGPETGRGLAHEARYLEEGEDPAPAQSLRVESQELPATLMGFVPRQSMWLFMKPFASSAGMRALNAARMAAGRRRGAHAFRQSHASFAFLLDYVPDWKRVYLPAGLIQFQSFIPIEHAARCFDRQMALCHEAGIHAYLGVLKKHRPDGFLMSHAVDGYSLALDFPVTRRNRSDLWALAQRLTQAVLECGGRFYFAKDSTLTAGAATRYLGAETVAEFSRLKRQCDPEGLLQTSLSRRLFGEFEV